MTRIQLSVRQAWIRAYDRADDSYLLSGGNLDDHGILHAKRLLKGFQSSKEWDISITYKSNHYEGCFELDGQLQVRGVDRQTVLNEIIERILREERASNGSLDQDQPKASTAEKS